METGNYLLLIDGSSLLSTQFFGNLPREILFAKTPEEKEKYFHKIMMTSGGVYTNAVYGFLRTLFAILRDQRPQYLAVAWDLTRDTFRRRLYPDYKGNRTETMAPLSEQFELCQRVLREMNIPEFMSEEFEADDYCGTLAAKFEEEIPVRIFTKDHDYLQLVTDRTHMWLMHSSQEKTDEMYKKYRIDRNAVNLPARAFELDPKLVREEFGVDPENINSLKGLQGDSSDNIKGVPGVGPATAVKLIRKYKTVDGLYREIKGLDKAGQERIKKEWKEELGITRSPLSFLLKESDTELVGEKSARLSEELATIRRDIELGDLALSDLSTELISRDGVQKALKELEFSSIKADFFDTEKPQQDITEKFRTVTVFSEFEAVSGRLLTEECLGISLDPDGTLSAVTKDGTGYTFSALSSRASEASRGIPSGTANLDEISPLAALGRNDTEASLQSLIQKLSSAGITLYTPDGKALVKFCGEILRDVVVAAYLLNPLKSDYEIRSVAAEYLEKETLPDHPASRAWAAVSAGLLLDQKLSESGMLKLYEEIELPVMGVLARMEQSGVAVKREELLSFSESLKERIRELEQEIYDLSGEEFNINSPKQLGEVLFDHLRLPHGKKTKSGYSTAAEILERLAPGFPLVQKILDYRTYSKLNSTYAEGLQQFIREDGRIHGDFNQTVTATGRLSSANPNLQNIPVRLDLGREIRKVFVPKEGCIFIDADYSQIELRVLAHLSGDQNLIAAYREAKDIHAITASQVFHVPLEEVTPLLRRNAKAVNFGIVYGISAFSLADDLSITRDEAQQYMRNYFATYPRIKAYLDHTVQSAKDKGYAETMFGRRRPIPELLSVNFNQRAFGERVAMNSPIQGTAADIMKIAMIRVDRKLREEGLRSRIVLQIHDELLLEVPEEEADRAEEILVSEMEHAADLAVKLEVEAKRGRSWYETK